MGRRKPAEGRQAAMMLSEKVTGDSSLIRAMSLLESKRTFRFVKDQQTSSEERSLFFFFLPDEERVPFLVNNNVSGAHEHVTLLCLYQAVLSQGHSILLVIAAN